MTGGVGKGRAGGALACSGLEEEAMIGFGFGFGFDECVRMRGGDWKTGLAFPRNMERERGEYN